MNEDFPKFQYSRFDNQDGQYVVRTNDQAEFKDLVGMVNKVIDAQAPATRPVAASQTQKTASPSGDRPKVPYMHPGDPCPTCNIGSLEKTQKQTKTGEKYFALVCDQPNCRGMAYLSKFPKFGATAAPFGAAAPKEEVIQLDDQDLPF